MDVIVGHVNADFDCLGGLVGAGRLYPGAALVLPGGESPAVREFLSLHREVLETRAPGDIEADTITRVIVVDTCARRRLGPAAKWLDLPGVEVHLYDHHPNEGCDVEAGERHVRPWGSVSSILAHILRERGLTPTPVEATALLLGIYEDTGSLSYAGTTPEDAEAAAWLLRQGGDLEVVAEFTRKELTPEQRRLLQALLEDLRLHESGGLSIAVAVAPPGRYVDEAAVLAHRLLDMQECAAVFIVLPMDGAVYVIGRSRSDAVDVGAALRELGGGGHARAASATVKGEAPAAMMERLFNRLDHCVSPERTAREIMSYPVRTISPDAEVAEARRRMVRYGHSGLVVMDDGRLAGVLTRRDVDKARHHRLDHAKVRGFMTSPVETASPETPLAELERVMLAENIGRLPVLRGEEVVGIVTRTDVLKARYGERYLAGAPPVAEEPVSQMLAERLRADVQRLLHDVGEVARREGARAYVVGGFVRDLILGERNLDVDIVVEPDGVALARAFARETGGQVVKVDAPFYTAKVRLPDGFVVDFATARTETYARPGALPEVEPSSVVDDLRRRDFTINAMAIALRPEQFGELLDPFGGRADLDRRRIRVLHNLSFLEDPTRIFRAVRFEERFHFKMDAHTEALARRAVEEGALGSVTPERLRREVFGTFREKKPLGPLLRLEALGVLGWLAPGVELDRRLLQSVPGALDWWKREEGAAADGPLVYLAALLAPLGREAALPVRERLRLPPPGARVLEEALRAGERAAELLAPEATPAAVTERLRPLPAEALVLLRARCGAAGPDGDKEEALLDRFVGEWRHTKLEITGEDLKAVGCPAGPALGEALRCTLQAKLNGEVCGREAELGYARGILDRRT